MKRILKNIRDEKFGKKLKRNCQIGKEPNNADFVCTASNSEMRRNTPIGDADVVGGSKGIV